MIDYMEGFFIMVSALVLAPFLLGIINRTKAIFGGRNGVPLLQAYYDMGKLLQKNFVYSHTTSWMIKAIPLVSFLSCYLLLLLLPLNNYPSFFSFQGDVFLMIYLLGLIRFFTVLSAMDTGSSFEGMGSARELFFGALAEPALVFVFVALAVLTHSLSVSEIFGKVTFHTWMEHSPQLILIVVALFIVLLLESSRIPFDDPNTHLELTMIHEVMVLDHGSFDLGLILYSSALKLWILSSLLMQIVIPMRSSSWPISLGVHILSVFGLAVVIGIVESTMARLRLSYVPRLIMGAFLLSSLAMFLM